MDDENMAMSIQSVNFIGITVKLHEQKATETRSPVPDIMNAHIKYPPA